MVRDELRVGDAVVRRLENLMLLVAFADLLDCVRLFDGFQHRFRWVLGDVLGFAVGQGERAGEDATGVDTVELPRF